MHPLTGYCDRWSVKPGARLSFMVSSADGRAFDLRFVRLLCADPNPHGPGYEEIAMPSSLDGERDGRFQPAHPGSYGMARRVPLALAEGVILAVTLWPTTPRKGKQGLVSLAGEGWRLGLGIDAAGGACLEFSGPDGTVTRAAVPVPMLERCWYDIAASFDPVAGLRVVQRPRRPYGTIVDAGEASAAAPASRPTGPCDVILAAAPPRDAGGPVADCFNGKLERPCLWQPRTGLEAVLERQRGALPYPGNPDLLFCWNASRDIPGNHIPELRPGGVPVRLHNLPARAVTGASWTGEVHDWTLAPDQYGAVHFHDDDLGNLGWEESFALDIPADWPSGFYAARIRNGAGEDMIPFFVRPVTPRAALAFLVPTYTYQVYGNHALPGRGAEIRARAEAWGALTETPDGNPQFGLSMYNSHSDGSGVAFATMLRPMLDTRPRQIVMLDPGENASGTSRICSDSYILRWLIHLGVEHDVITDHDLHEEGGALLAPYRTVIAAQHPEYLSARMMDAVEGYLEAGGRLMYLGGNGFYWRAEPSEAEPDALEIRRAEGGIRVWATEPGENHHAFGGGFGGLWRRIGRPAHRLVGNGFSAQGRQLGFPYRFTPAIRDPRVAFMTAGLDAAPGQEFGERGFMGGGAVGFELDSVDPRLGTPPHTLVVAKGVVIHPDYHIVNEDRLATRLPKAQEDWSCADMLFFETPAGGAVFSVGSMTFAGSLPVDGYGSPLARLTGNVLRRFLDPEPFV
ncbi:N,N-dimethylformamidase beta subunit family domain-containing protein [Roseomonas sp. BN140053]|uniref:N,N-dimethylformamidase beta subunit family domain-containing protein n=1 Tax=Roseomonas sp. BN140053 TaxID=3391898 RepID=UPI0039E74BC1